MKIISKYKDFYDYLAQDHDADIVYNRKPKFISERILSKFMDRRGKFTDIIYYSYNKSDRKIQVSYMHFGVYPYVYVTPYLKIKTSPYDRISYLSQFNTQAYNHSHWIDEYRYVFLNKENIDSFKTNKDLVKFAQKYTSLPLKEDDINFRDDEPSKYIDKNYVGKIECKDIFKYIESPVFCEYDSNILDTVIYVHELDELYKTDSKKYTELRYIGDCCFNKLNKDILKYWINELMNLNTYINIENFLWSIKQEPISNPDNKTKILSHGFDLKTSFRKM